MLKKMIFRGTVFVGSLVAAYKIMDVVEEASKKRNTETKKVIDLIEDEDTITEAEVEMALSL